MRVEIQNLTSSKIDRAFIRKIVGGALQSLKIKGNIKIGVVFLGSGKMQELNKKYRGIDSSADVLSVSYGGGDGYLGEILLCMSEIRKKAKEYSNTTKKELAHALVHGVLHLLGWEHERSQKETNRMHKKEEEILARVL